MSLRLCIVVTLILLVSSLVAHAARADETLVIAAALEAYFNQIHGGTGVAFPERRRPVLLHNRTVKPTAAQMRVSVFSPANRDASARYGTPETAPLIAAMIARSERPVRVSAVLPHFFVANGLRGKCGPELDDSRFVDAVAVSRPAFGRHADALVYLEYAGGARAYYLARMSKQWKVQWYVELWACG